MVVSHDLLITSVLYSDNLFKVIYESEGIELSWNVEETALWELKRLDKKFIMELSKPFHLKDVLGHFAIAYNIDWFSFNFPEKVKKLSPKTIWSP